MRNFRLNVILAALSALSFADEAVASAGGTVSNETVAAGKPTTAVQAHRTLKQPVVDVSKLSEEQAKSMLASLMAQRGSSRDAVKTIRFNNGTESTFYAPGEKMRDGKIAEGGEVNSARDSGTLSIYGFGRNPISLYANQWIDLFLFGGAVVDHIVANADAINAYVRAKAGNEGGARDINVEGLLSLKSCFDLLDGIETRETPETGETGEEIAAAS